MIKSTKKAGRIVRSSLQTAESGSVSDRTSVTFEKDRFDYILRLALSVHNSSVSRGKVYSRRHVRRTLKIWDCTLTSAETRVIFALSQDLRTL